ncbi:dipeptide ABC transporter ATP-binding protein [Cellulomonas cellasea]|uniref:dipeptide ABC transporter ATP-binding protein n=1 Tax=Cellulomonas cellasea TaxID=43670 RepID=UPI0037BF5C70
MSAPASAPASDPVGTPGSALLSGRAHAPVSPPLLRVVDLAVEYRTRRGPVHAVRGVSLTVEAGQTVALVGESGSGKSTTAHAVVGLLAPAAHVTAGRVELDGRDLLTAPRRELRALRGLRVGFVPQDPTVSLNPVVRVGEQVAEVLRVHGLADRRTARVEAVEALRRAGLPDPEVRAQQYPHELSGGMRQRVLIAIAMVAGPGLLVADEPTSALDVTVQRQILDHLEHVTTETGTGALLVTHDLGVAADRAQQIVVMSQGVVVEAGTPDEVLGRPRHPYTQALLAAAPSLRTSRAHALRPAPGEAAPADARLADASSPDGPPVGSSRTDARPAGAASDAAASALVPVLEVRALVKDFALSRAAGGGTLRAVDGLGFRVLPGRTVALVGESGSGKSTTARLAVRLAEPTSGQVLVDGADVTHARGRALREARRRVQVVYQNPYASLNPGWSVEELVADPLRVAREGTRRTRRDRAAELLDLVALPASALGRRAAELSGGQRQRVAIARALALEPAAVVLDEPVSALDVSVQAQVLDLLADLQARLGVSYLFISHDLAVVRQVAHDVVVMRRGVAVEQGPVERVLTAPEHPYTAELLGAVPGRRALAAAAASATSDAAAAAAGSAP